MQTTTTALISELNTILEAASIRAKSFRGLTRHELNFKKSEIAWSVLECLEHLNLYGDFYLPEIEKRMITSGHTANAASVFKSGVLGNYFANLMKVNASGQVKKMKSPKDKNPGGSELSVTSIDRFLKQIDLLMVLLERARFVDLTKTKTSISISPSIKLRLGDTFRFLVYHIERHVMQAERAVSCQLSAISPGIKM